MQRPDCYALTIELGRYLDMINSGRDIRHAFYELGTQGKQILKFLLQPQVIKLQTLGNFSILLNEILSLSKSDVKLTEEES